DSAVLILVFAKKSPAPRVCFAEAQAYDPLDSTILRWTKHAPSWFTHFASHALPPALVAKHLPCVNGRAPISPCASPRRASELTWRDRAHTRRAVRSRGGFMRSPPPTVPPLMPGSGAVAGSACAHAAIWAGF